jgi:DNA-binding Lrp family transcriptional regulator
LDAVDWTIIRQLQTDGRTSYKALGEAVGFSGLGAKKRVEKLLARNLICPTVLVNTDALDIRLAMILLEMDSADAVRMTIERYSDCPRVLNFFSTLGGYNLIALVMAEDQGTLESESMEQCALRSGAGIRRSEFYPIRSVYYSPFLPLRIASFSAQSDIAPCGVECHGCPSYQTQKCVGCPATRFYRGPLEC